MINLAKLKRNGRVQNKETKYFYAIKKIDFDNETITCINELSQVATFNFEDVTDIFEAD